MFEYSGGDHHHNYYKEYIVEQDYTYKRHTPSYGNSVVRFREIQSGAEQSLSDLQDTKFEVAVHAECMNLDDMYVDDGNDGNAEKNGLSEVGDQLFLKDVLRTEYCAEIIE